MTNAVQTSKTYSQFINRWLEAQPTWEVWLNSTLHTRIDPHRVQSIFTQELPESAWLDVDESTFLAKLRVARQKVMLWLGVRDINQLANLSEVMHATTELAQQSLYYTSEFAKNDLKKLYGIPCNAARQPISMWIIGMGKLGAKELNVSSDIDLIFLYESDGMTLDGERSISHHEWFDRQGKRIIRYLTEVTPQGFVFRVDMRLRPNGDSGPLVVSLDMLEEYFLVQGREWERYAWIKARLVYPLDEADESGLPTTLKPVVRSFVYRKYLDFGIIDSIRRLHRQIRYEANLRAQQYPDRAFDIKLGKGGIREIEFLAQMYQLIRGGQENLLRTRSTVEVITHIAKLKLMSESMAQELQSAYDFLRKLEHLLQWRNDAQVHYLPNDPHVVTQIAKVLGYDRDEFVAHLTTHLTIVANYFANAFTLENGDENSLPSPSGSFEQYPQFTKNLERIKASSRFQLMGEVSKQNVDYILLYVLDHYPQIEEGLLIKLLDFLEVIFRRSSYLSLLKEYPKAIHQVIRLLQASHWASEFLMKHAHLLDDLLLVDNQKFSDEDENQYWQKWQSSIEEKIHFILHNEQDEEAVWNTLRQAHQSEIFQILLADLGGFNTAKLPLERISDRLSKLADIIITVTLNFVWDGLRKKYAINKPLNELGFAVIAYGKLGGKELGYGSDLDLVFIYDASLTDVFSLEIQPVFANLVRKFILAITTATRAGVLYEIDTRLRPNGESGLLVSSLDSYENYQKNIGSNTAWVWEHQALTRARFCCGDERVGKRFEQIRAEVLSIERDCRTLAREVTQMREKLYQNHTHLQTNFDLKHDRGGMIDIEFMIQYLILCRAHQYPDLIQNIGNIALLHLCAKHDLMTENQAQQVASAYRLFRKLQHQIRLDGNQVARVEDYLLNPEIESARQAVLQLWGQLLEL